MTDYQNLQIQPFQLVSIQDLRLTKKVNEHATLHLTGIVPEEIRDQYVELTETQTTIEVNQLVAKGAPIPLFKGMILSIQVRMTRGIYYMEMEAASSSYLLDIKRQHRSFQDTSILYDALLKQIGASYQGFDVIDEATNGAKLESFTLQYAETDWQLMKRLASRFQAGLVPAVTFAQPKLYFGMPIGRDQGKLKDYHYTVRKKLADYLCYIENGNSGMEEYDFLSYEVETDKVFAIGDTVNFNGRTLYVGEVLTTMANGLLKHHYTLCTQNGLKQPEIFNERLTGLSLEGKVLEVAKDHLKLHLAIDEKQDKDKAHWFLYASPYTAEGNSGWYAMPEINDFVQLSFPTQREETAVVSHSIRKNRQSSATNKLDDPATKYYRTAFGKEIKMSPDEIVITAKDGGVFIRLNEASGIELYSKGAIQFISQADIAVNAGKKLVVSAEESISLQCKESKVTMDGNVQMLGKEVKAN